MKITIDFGGVEVIIERDSFKPRVKLSIFDANHEPTILSPQEVKFLAESLLLAANMEEGK